MKGAIAPRLTKREQEVATLVWRGYKIIEVARELGIAYDTAKRHLYLAFDKTGMGSAVELALWMERTYGQSAAPEKQAVRVSGTSARFHVTAEETIHGPEIFIEIVGVSQT